MVEWKKIPGHGEWEEALDGRLLLANEHDESYPWVIIIHDGVARSWRVAGHFAGKSDAKHFVAAMERVLA